VNRYDKNTLFLIDGSSFLYRAYYGLRPLHTPQGNPVQAVYGFCRMIKKLMEKFDPQQIVLVWDSKGKTERHEIFSEYKSTRQAPPSDLFEQKELIIQFADLIGLKQYAKVGVEADDLMYSLATWWTHDKKTAVIITSDKDMGQALNESITIYDSFKDIIIDNAAFKEKMEFEPNKTIFYFSLVGDTSDNIPGVKGIGAKGALELVTAYDSLKNLYARLETVTSKRLKSALEGHKEDAFLSEQLFTLKYHDVQLKQQDVLFDKDGWNNARPLFEQLHFTSLVKEIPAPAVQQQLFAAFTTSKDRGYNFVCITKLADLEALVDQIKHKKLFAYDTETDSVNSLQCNMVGLSICLEEKTSYYIPCGHITDDEQLSIDVVVAALKDVFEDPIIGKIAHHAKFDQLVLSNYNIHVQGTIFDTMIAASLVKEEWQKASLKELSQVYLSEPMLTYQEVVEAKKFKHFGYVPLQDAVEYAAADAHQTFKLYPILQTLLADKDLVTLYNDIELPLIQVLAAMEERGIYCDVQVLQTLNITVMQQLEQIQRTIIAMIDPAYASINLNSPRQVEDLLFNSLKLTPQKKSAKRTGYSTDNEVLLELSKDHPIPSYIVQYRELFKLKSTYIDALPTYVNPKTGRIHTTYSQNRVATGRLSSSEPNLQNIPAEGLGSTVRMAFKAGRDDQVLISADYSQIELRILAHVTQDPVLLSAFKHGHDIHAQTAAGIFGVPLDQVTAHQRSVGKRINFSILYGLTPYGLSKDLDISLKDAKYFIDTYFSHYKNVRPWMDGVIEEAKRKGYVTTLFGRRRAVPGLKEKNKNLYELACRIAINTIPQGTSAEIMKIGMLRVESMLKNNYNDAHLLLQIHDQILVECNKKDADFIEKNIKKELESVVSWDTPLIVSTGMGRSWKDAE
jgi:DNA polymerase-1